MKTRYKLETTNTELSAELIPDKEEAFSRFRKLREQGESVTLIQQIYQRDYRKGTTEILLERRLVGKELALCE